MIKQSRENQTEGIDFLTILKNKVIVVSDHKETKQEWNTCNEIF